MVENTIVVTGATGTQGGAVARALLHRGHDVAAFVRDDQAPKARELRGLGARLIHGDLDDEDAIERAVDGASGLFLLGVPDPALQIERPQAERWVEAARRHRLPHLIYSSIANADQGTGIPHFEVKREIEAMIGSSGVPATIVAPAYLMENNTTDFALAGLRQGRVERFWAVDRPVLQAAAADIGACVCTIFERGASMHGRRFDIASDAVTTRQLAVVLGEVLGTRLEARRADYPLPLEPNALTRSLEQMLRWLEDPGFVVDRARLRAEFPEVNWLDIRTWARSSTWSV